jgi:chemotaxis protein methyltransferase CheR
MKESGQLTTDSARWRKRELQFKPEKPGRDDPCRYFIDFIYERTRIRLHEGKAALIRSRLGKNLRRLGLADLDAYVGFLKTQADEDEFKRVVDALTTNHTQFLREHVHFEFLIKTALPGVLKPGQSRFRIWSAACSSGEEPYSMAMYLAEAYPPLKGWDWRISATDISTRVLAIAQSGIYRKDHVKTVPSAWLRRYFENCEGVTAGHVQVKHELARRVDFGLLNLAGAYQPGQKYEVIFCRNVMMYFDPATREQMLQRMCRFLVPGGFLFTGLAESLNGIKAPLRRIKPSVYQNE